MCGQTKHVVLGRHTFNGFTHKLSYGDGKFTVGKTYDRVTEIDTYAHGPESGDDPYPDDARFVDDNGQALWEAVANFTAAE